jgi:hypothetical protein
MKRRVFSTHLLKQTTSGILILSVFLGFAADTSEANAPETLSEGGADISASTEAAVLAPDLETQVTDLEERVRKIQEDEQEILWFARAIRSETERTDEQYLIAWIIRNRVDTGFRGTTYKEVVLSPGQFSGLVNPRDPNYARNRARTYESQDPAWKTALATAKDVYYAGDSERPFAKTVRHFYSPEIVAAPGWARDKSPVHKTTDGTHYVRFAFYEGVE